MSFEPWDAAKSGITLPIRGVDYVIAPIGYQDEIRIQAAQDEIDTAVQEKRPPNPDLIVGNEDYLRMILGPVLDQMRTDNVPNVAIVHAAVVTHTFNVAGREAAEKAWAEGLDPEALAASMKAAQKELARLTTASPPSPATASANRTRSASTTSTTSRKATPRSPAARKAASSAGRKSSPAKR